MFATMPPGSWVESRDNATVQEIYRLYGHRVKVQKIEHRDLFLVVKHPYRIMQWVQSESHPDGGFYEPLMGVDRLDNRVLQTLAEFDNHKGWRALALLDEWDERERREQEAKEQAWQEEADKLIAAAFRNDRSFTFKPSDLGGEPDGKVVKLNG